MRDVCGKVSQIGKSSFFYNMDISLIIALMYLKICMYNAEICFEGILSQNVDKGLSFGFMMYRIKELERNDKKWQRLSVFGHRI